MPALRAGRAFDGERSLAGPVTVLVAHGGIEAVERGHPDVPGAGVVDLGQDTVLPGLIDTRVHLGADSGNGALDRLPTFTAEHLDAVIEDGLDRHLRAGVTTVRDLGDRDFSVLEQRSRHRQRVLASGPPITCPRGHCWSMGGEEALRRAVRERADRRADVGGGPRARAAGDRPRAQPRRRATGGGRARGRDRALHVPHRRGRASC
ncbi:amidohydrolase family protein [Lentzea sp. NPDC060358]|uniref:amidohydrolase family protein n=1 Tax=Lentzea sp. NPDC060358 TaxID=3347103 RepID=UPI00365920C7